MNRHFGGPVRSSVRSTEYSQFNYPTGLMKIRTKVTVNRKIKTEEF